MAKEFESVDYSGLEARVLAAREQFNYGHDVEYKKINKCYPAHFGDISICPHNNQHRWCDRHNKVCDNKVESEK